MGNDIDELSNPSFPESILSNEHSIDPPRINEPLPQILEKQQDILPTTNIPQSPIDVDNDNTANVGSYNIQSSQHSSANEIPKNLKPAIIIVSIIAAIAGLCQVIFNLYLLVINMANYNDYLSTYGFWYTLEFSITTMRVPFSLFFIVVLFGGVYYLKQENKSFLLVVVFFLMLYFSFFLIYAVLGVEYLMIGIYYGGTIFLDAGLMLSNGICALMIAALIGLYVYYLKKQPENLTFTLFNGIKGIPRFNDPNQLKKIILVLSAFVAILASLLLLEVGFAIFGAILSFFQQWMFYEVSVMILQVLKFAFLIFIVVVIVFGVKATKQNEQMKIVAVVGFLILFFATCITSSTNLIISYSLYFNEGYYLDAFVISTVMGVYTLCGVLVALLIVAYGFLLKLLNSPESSSLP